MISKNEKRINLILLFGEQAIHFQTIKWQKSFGKCCKSIELNFCFEYGAHVTHNGERYYATRETFWMSIIFQIVFVPFGNNVEHIYDPSQES